MYLNYAVDPLKWDFSVPLSPAWHKRLDSFWVGWRPAFQKQNVLWLVSFPEQLINWDPDTIEQEYRSQPLHARIYESGDVVVFLAESLRCQQ